MSIRKIAPSVLRRAGVVTVLTVSFCVAGELFFGDEPTKTVLSEGQNNTTVRVHVGDVISVQLPAQMGTGYSWKLKSLESKVAELMGKPKLKSPRNIPPGGAELQIFDFKIVSAGSATLQLDYVHPWEKNPTPLKSFKVQLSAGNQ